MKNRLRHLTVFMIVTAMVFCMLAGCGTREEDLDPMAAADGYEDEDFEEEYYEEDYYEEEPEPEEEYEEVQEPEEVADRAAGDAEEVDAEEGDAGEGVDIADGTYITDETYIGDLSAEGETLAIETALSHYDDDWNLVPDYEKRTYVFTTSKDCKCVIFTEDKEEAPIAEKVEFINEFLEGNSGLPITLVIKNNELVEIQFSS